MKFLSLIAAMSAASAAAAPVKLWPTEVNLEANAAGRERVLNERMANQRLASIFHRAHFFNTRSEIYREVSVGGEIEFGIPNYDGTLDSKTCRLLGGNPAVPQALADKFPDIDLFHCVTDEVEELNIIYDRSREGGLKASFFSKDRRLFFVDSVVPGTDLYVIYDAETAGREGLAPDFDDELFELVIDQSELANVAPVKRFGSFPAYKFIIAPLANAQYSLFHGDTKTSVMAELINMLSRVNGVYAHELAVFFEFHEDSDLGICLSTDDTSPCNTVVNSGNVIYSSLSVLSDLGIDSATYDIGHVFTTGSGGLAALASLCNSRRKAQGTTGLPEPFTDVYYIDYVAHEIGHQLNGGHVFKDCAGPNDGNYMDMSGSEPGSGSSIMGYAGICGKNNIQSNSDPYFGNLNIQQMRDFVESVGGGDCGEEITIDNSLPEVSVLETCQVPVGNYFQLKGASNSASEDDTFFSWDRIDTGAEDFSDPSLGQIRSFKPIRSMSRFIPNLYAINFPTDISSQVEQIPTKPRSMTFRFTERRLYKTTAVASVFSEVIMGDFQYDDTVVEFVNLPALKLTSPSSGDLLTPGSNVKVQWDGLTKAGLTVGIYVADNTMVEVGKSEFDYEDHVQDLEWLKVGESPIEKGEAVVTIPSTFSGLNTNVMIKSSLSSAPDDCFFFAIAVGVNFANATSDGGSEGEDSTAAIGIAAGVLLILAGALATAFAAIKLSKKAPKPQATPKFPPSDLDEKVPANNVMATQNAMFDENQV